MPCPFPSPPLPNSGQTSPSLAAYYMLDRGPSLNGVRGFHFMGLIVGGKAPEDICQEMTKPRLAVVQTYYII